MAKLRRDHFDVHAALGSVNAAEALEWIATLYVIKKEARNIPPGRHSAIRRVQTA